MTNITESASNYNDIEKMPTQQILAGINQEDSTVADAVGRAMPQISALVDAAYPRMRDGGRLFYIGAGTSGRLGIVDASECPPTFGVPQGLVVGLMAGGDKAMRKAVEFAEDDENQAWKDLSEHDISSKDVLIGIAASGRTPYVIGGIVEARKNGVLTGCISNNPDSKLAEVSEYPIEVVTGPEFITGSTRMKAGTAQKLTLNMISTALMVKLGHVKGSRMVDMQLSNLKLVDRGERMLMDELDISREEARQLLQEHKGVRIAIEAFKRKRIQ